MTRAEGNEKEKEKEDPEIISSKRRSRRRNKWVMEWTKTDRGQIDWGAVRSTDTDPYYLITFQGSAFFVPLSGCLRVTKCLTMYLMIRST